MAGDASMFAARPPKRGAPRLALLGAVALLAGGGVWLVRGPLRRPAARAAVDRIAAPSATRPPRPAAGRRSDAADGARAAEPRGGPG